MAELTKRFGFNIPQQDDYYDVDQYGGNLRIIEQNAVNGAGVLTLRALTAEEYGALEKKDAETLYFVTGDSGFAMYLGELPLQNGGGNTPASAEVVLAAETGTIGHAEFEEAE